MWYLLFIYEKPDKTAIFMKNCVTFALIHKIFEGFNFFLRLKIISCKWQFVSCYKFVSFF